MFLEYTRNRIKMTTYAFLILLLRITALMAVEQKFAMEPQDQTAIVGSRVTLPCRVINKSGQLQWTKDDFGLGTHRNLSGFDRYSMIGSDEEGDFSLDIYPVMLEDDAQYQCQVSPGPMGEAEIRSSYAKLSVLIPPDPPQIIQGETLITTEDREIELECVSSNGKPPSEITWLDGSGAVITEGIESIVEAVDSRRFTVKSILKLTPKKEDHNSTFVCQAQNTAERTHKSAKLRLEVKYAPKVTVSVVSGAAQNGRIPEGSTVKLSCEADANPADVTYKWYLNEVLVTGDWTTQLVVANVSRRQHDVLVKCEVHNAVGKSEESESLDISYGPHFRTKPKSLEADTGSSVTLSCDVDGNPPPDISWIHEPTDRIVGNNPNLTIRVDANSAGRYYCKASVLGYPEIGSEATIFLKGPPKIISHKTQFGIQGDNVRVECTAFSIPKPDKLSWSFNGRQVDDKEYTILEDKVPEGVKSTLIIRDSQKEHFGSYNCTVLNTYGSDTVEIVLMPQKTFPMLLVIVSVVSTVLILIIISLILFLCQRQNKKPPGQEPEKTSKDSDRSSNISDLKLDLRTGSSVSNVHCELDFLPKSESETGSESVLTRIGVPLAGPVNVPNPDLYRFPDYNKPGNYLSYQPKITNEYVTEFNNFPPKEGHNNNGYVPYVDYSREYTPPNTQIELSLSPLQPLNGSIDPRFSATYGNPYLRSSNILLPPPHTAIPAATPAPPPYTKSSQKLPDNPHMNPQQSSLSKPPTPEFSENPPVSTINGGGAQNGAVPQVARLPNSPTTQYIVPNANLATMKRGTLATHV